MALSREHPCFLGRYAFGFSRADFHREWQDFFSAHRRAVLWAPIDHGKSSQLTVLRQLVELGKNPDGRYAIISYRAKQAEKWLGQIRTNIEHNQRLRLVYPRLRLERRPGWLQIQRHDAIMIERSAGAAFTQKDYSLQALGVEGAILGARLDGIILDDVLGPMNTQTAYMRQKVRDWFLSTVVGRVVEGGYIWIIGTAWHEDDLAHWLKRERGDVYACRRYQAGHGSCRWESRWPEYDQYLAEQFAELREVEYARQYLNEPIGESTEFFNIGRMRASMASCTDPARWWHGLTSEERRRFRWVTCGVDMGFARTGGSAETAFFVLGISKDDEKKHVLHIRTGRWMGADLLRQMIDVWRLFGVREFLFETNAGASHVAEMTRDRAILAALGVKRDEVRRLRVFGQFTTQHNRNDVKWGIRGLAPEFDADEWRIPGAQPQVETWISEAKIYTPEDHPGDRLIAGWLASIRMRGKGKEMALKARTIGGR